jgi:hypothetical protein
MLKVIIITLFSVSFLLNETVTSEHRNYQAISVKDSAIKQKAKRLQVIYSKLSQTSYMKYERAYFKAFPESFEVFQAIFGFYPEDPNKGFLYDSSRFYIFKFFKVKIPKENLYSKAVDIAINGKWHGDAANYFQGALGYRVIGNEKLFARILSKHSKDDIKSFWYFYFDGPHPPNKIPDELNKFKEIDPDLYELIKQSFAKVKADTSH